MRLFRPELSSCIKIGFLVAVCWAQPLIAQVAPPLGQAGTFAVLGGSAVSNTGPTSVVGDLGISPGSSITGFPPGIISGGVIHATDAVALGAQSDVAVAYTNLAGQPSDANLTGQDLGGLTLTSGVYTFNSSAQLTGTLTLDAQGDPAAVFVFQIGSSLTTASASQVVVINGGANCNVFWQVGSSATLGTTTAFVGNILALTSITLTTGATNSGRLLARNGAITLDSNNVAVCASCSIITVLPATLPAGALGQPYTQTLSASGGSAPYTFSISSGSLPPGLLLSAAGLVSGTPTSVGSFTFTVQASDANGCIGARTYTIVINTFVCGTINVFPATLPAPLLGVPYNQSVGASGGSAPYTFAVSAGAIPAGLTFIATGTASASLIGTPNALGAYTFTVSATDALGCTGNQTYGLQLVAGSVPVAAPALSLSVLVLLGLLVGAWGVLSLHRQRM
jgi:hypothetical protein